MTSLQDSVANLFSVGAKRYEALKQLGIETVEDLLTHFPFRYEDLQVRAIEELLDEDKVTLKGTVVTQPTVSYFGRQKNRLAFKMAIEHHVISVVFFNQPYLKNKVDYSQEVAVFGKWDEKRKTLLGMKILGVQDGGQTEVDAIYHTNKSLKQKTLQTIIKTTYDAYAPYILEMLPSELIDKYQFMSYKDAIYTLHFEQDRALTKSARERMIYQELLLYQLKLSQLKANRKRVESIAFSYKVEALREYIHTIPFELTAAQKRVTNEICKDLLSTYPMNRLLQGDVGSGKTIVASIAIYATKLSGYQSAVLVPTEILGQQHFESIRQSLEPFHVNVALLTSSTKTKEKKMILEQLNRGEIDCLIGTHALLYGDVVFSQLGLIIIDEQHRFGVTQRQQLKEKASVENVLYMSATPIPRTLSLSLFGDMDVSIIDELPKGRKEIITRWVKDKQFEQVLTFAKSQIQIGRQVYVVTPLIEESELSDLKNAEEMYTQIKMFLGEAITVALLHGKLKSQEKEDIMTAYVSGEIDVLVSTTVIEVGVNVPNATIMIIQDAERFGLSQLHQLRGRIGRGVHQSYCILVANPKTENGKERMKIMTKSNDGFYLSQKDLEMRGSGDVFGVRQSGVPKFKVADIVVDSNLLNCARIDANEMVQTNTVPACLQEYIKEVD